MIGVPPNDSQTQSLAEIPLLDFKKENTLPIGWPATPERIQASSRIAILHVVLDLMLFIFSLAFMAFGIIVYLYDRTPTAEYPETKKNLLNAAKYGPTVFPILFASVIGRTTHTILRWRLEKGERIGILDVLATSTSLTNTVAAQCQLRLFSAFGAILILLWALSPVGGQAAIRQISIGTEIASRSDTFLYTVHHGDLSRFEGPGNNTYFAIVNTLFNAGLIAPWSTRISPVDPWVNVKIPRIEYYERTGRPDSDGWLTTNASVYASFIGVPIKGIATNTTTSYVLPVHASYLNLQCTSINATESMESSGNSTIKNVGQAIGMGADIWWTTDRNQHLDTSISKYLPLRNFMYIKKSGDLLKLSCNMTTTYVETEVSCQINSPCRASKVRRSRIPRMPPGFTLFDQAEDYWRLFVEKFLTSIGGDISSFSTLGRYLADPRLLLTDHGVSFEMETKKPNDEEYSNRFSQLMNSYVECIGNLLALTGGINGDTSFSRTENITWIPPQQHSELPHNSSYKWFGDGFKSKAWRSNGTISTHTEVIAAQKTWVVTLGIISFLLMECCLLSVFVRCFCNRAPDLAMNISSLAARNGPYMSLPTTGSHMDASDRARLLKNVRVRFGDVDPCNDVGNLTIAMHGMEGERVQRIKKGRLYE